MRVVRDDAGHIRYFALILFGVACWFTGPLPAADVLALDLKQAIHLALRPEAQARMRSVQLEKQISGARLAQAQAATALQVSASATESMFRFDLRALGVDIPEVSPFVVNVNLRPVVGPFSMLDTRVTAIKPLIDRGAAGQIATEKSRGEESKAKELLISEQIAAETARAFLAASLAESAVELAESAVSQAEFAVRVESERKTLGLVTGAETRKANLDLMTAQQKLVSARSDKRLAELQLKALAGIDWDTQLRLLPLQEPESRGRTAEEALALGFHTRPDLKNYESRMNVLNNAAKAIEAQKHPTLTAFGNIGALTIAPTPSHSEAVAASYTYVAGMALRMPLLDGGRRAAQLAEVALQKRQIDNASQQVRQQIELQVRLALEKLRGAEEQMVFTSRQVQLVEEDLSQVTARQAAGEASALDLAEAQGRRFRMRYQHLVTMQEWKLARLALGEATGTVAECNW